MKDKNEILAECVNQKCFPDIDSPLDNLENVPQHQIKKAMDEYAEEYAKAFIEYSRAERFGLWELPDLFESFKESLKK